MSMLPSRRKWQAAPQAPPPSMGPHSGGVVSEVATVRPPSTPSSKAGVPSRDNPTKLYRGIQ